MPITRNNVAYVISEIQRITGKKPGKKAFQKLVYLIEADGIDLGFEYGIHFYGPYSAALDSASDSLVTDNIVQFEYKGHSHLMGIRQNCIVESELDKSSEQKICTVINRYKDKEPSSLELLATTHYVQKKLQTDNSQGIVAGVQKIKGSKYCEDEIKNAIKELGMNIKR